MSENELALKKFAEATGNEFYDPDWEGGAWLVDAAGTMDTIDDFVESAKGYRECARPQFGEIAGFRCVSFSRIQPRKGDCRRQLSVVDFGNIRYAIDADLSFFF